MWARRRLASNFGGRLRAMPGAEADREPTELDRELVEYAEHGDGHAARRILQDASPEQSDDRARDAGEADFERSSERDGQN